VRFRRVIVKKGQIWQRKSKVRASTDANGIGRIMMISNHQPVLGAEAL
jgi:hypothetical protein